MEKKAFINMAGLSIKSCICIIGFGILLTSCRKENEETYFKTTAPTIADTTYVTFSKNIKPIFDLKCVSCHVGGTAGNCDLDNYENTILYMHSHQPSTKLYDYIKDPQTPHAGVVMDSLELKQMSKWIQNPTP